VDHWRFSKLDAATDHNIEDFISEDRSYLFDDLSGMYRPGIVHGTQNAQYLQTGIEFPLDLFDDLNQRPHPSQGQVLTLEGNEHGVRGGQSIDG